MSIEVLCNRVEQLEQKAKTCDARYEIVVSRLEQGGKTMAEHALKIKHLCKEQEEQEEKQGKAISAVATDFKTFTVEANKERAKDANVRTGILVALCLNLVGVILMLLVSIGGGG